MNIFNIFLLLAIALVLTFSVPVKAQDEPDDYVDAHNRARIDVGVSPLVWNETLADYAEAYAELRHDCRFVLSGGPYGEVIVVGKGDLTAKEAVTVMVDQKSDYFYETNTCRTGKSCDSYKQVVWKNTVSLGCDKVKCDNGGSFTICEYYPSGNVAGEKPF
ncbi:Pathogenesis-related protein 1 [Cardamine amara subsp. amara]|uniref:Pathogenesis-related protein 1 n=1 Tax=Cardamine amara subsp. amara TaxID=228776 RepID=A0ABD1ABG0_CARAN